jgi:outer membrane protein TolC
VVTLDEAIHLATEQNSLVKMARDKAKEADGRVTQARANYFPVVTNQSLATRLNQTESLEIPKGALGNYSATGPLPGNNVSIELGKQQAFLSTTGAAQPITQMFKIHAGVSVAHADAAAAHSDVLQASNEVALNVKTLYYHLLSAERRKHALELRIQAGEQSLDEARKGVESGVVLEEKVLDGEAQLAEARHALGSVDDAIDDMEVQFDDLLGLPLATECELTDPDHGNGPSPTATPAAATISVEQLESEALDNNPAVISARHLVEKARAGVNAAHAEYIPDVTGIAQNIHQNGAPLLPTNTEVIGFQSQWTISEFGKRTGLVHERKSQLAEAEENLQHTENQLRIDIEKELRKLNRTSDELDAAQRLVKDRTEMLRIVEDQVHSSTANVSALRDAEAQLADAQAQLFDAEMDRAIAQAELDRTEGRQ